jgi:proteasome lid subunit RPN8/RPN11
LAEYLAMSMLEISRRLIVETVSHLRASRRRECVVLWLGRRDGELVGVREVFLPTQEAEADYFRIPEEGMAQVLARLRPERLMVAAQVHTHPHEAFHSPADDRWAIVRHVGGLSLVVPRFCQATTVDTFFDDAKVFVLDEEDRFREVSASAVYRVVR